MTNLDVPLRVTRYCFSFGNQSFAFAVLPVSLRGDTFAHLSSAVMETHDSAGLGLTDKLTMSMLNTFPQGGLQKAQIPRESGPTHTRCSGLGSSSSEV